MTPRPRRLGLHLGLLQFGHLMALQRSVSAAALTYALVLGAWLLGSLVGLWLPRHERTCILVGLAAHLAAHTWLLADPHVPFTALALLLPAVALAALAGGCFFARVLPTRPRTGPIFAAENDGFLLGMLLAVLGFAFVGRWFSLLAPLAGAALLLAPPLRCSAYTPRAPSASPPCDGPPPASDGPPSRRSTDYKS